MQTDNSEAFKSKFFADLLQETKPLSEVDIPYMSNWMLVSERLSHDVKDYQVVLSMLAHELDNSQRGQIINRLVSRFMIIVKTRAHDNFASYIKHGLKYRVPFREL